MRWIRSSLAFAFLVVLLALGTAWYLMSRVRAPNDLQPKPETASSVVTSSPEPIPDEEASSAYRLPGSWSFAKVIDDVHFHDSPARKDKAVPVDVLPTLTRSLDELLEGKRRLDDFALEVRWAEKGRGKSMTIHGDGLGIHWQGKQFFLSSEQRLDMLSKLKAAKFLAMPPVLGKSPESPKPSEQPNTDPPSGIIALRIGSEFKAVELRKEEFAHGDFLALGKNLMAFLKPSASSIGADSLDDGLQKIADRRLDPRAMQIEVMYFRHLEHHTLNVDGLSATDGGTDYFWRPFKGHKSLKLEDLAIFITSVQQARFATLLNRINADFDFARTIRVRVLNREYSVRAGNDYAWTRPLSPEEDRQRFLTVWRAADGLRPERIYEKKTED